MSTKKTQPTKAEMATKAPKEKEVVRCLDCNTEYDLFYDLEHITDVLSDGEEIEGIDIDNDRDPIRCVLCRKSPRVQCNETLQCEECLTSNTVFVWTGKYNDTIICQECNNAEQAKKQKKAAVVVEKTSDKKTTSKKTSKKI